MAETATAQTEARMTKGEREELAVALRMRAKVAREEIGGPA